MKKLIIFVIIVIGLTCQAYADGTCYGTISYKSGKELSQQAIFSTLVGQIVAYSDLQGNFSFPCTNNQIILVRVDSQSLKKVMNPGNNDIVIDDVVDPDPGCCSDCVNSDWYDSDNAGYQYRNIASCSSCVCSYTKEYRCADGWHGTTTDGETGCHECGGFIHDFNDNPLAGAEFFNLDGQKVTETNEEGEFGIACEGGIFIIRTSYGETSKILFTTSIDENLSAYQILLSNNMDIEACGPSMEYISGYYCEGILHLPCPKSEDGAPVTSSGQTTRAINHACYIPANTAISDQTGVFEYTSNCHYKK